MNYQFDELTKGMAQSVTRRAALKKFGAGLAGMALACFGLTNKAEAHKACYPSGTVIADISSTTFSRACHKCCSRQCVFDRIYYICQ